MSRGFAPRSLLDLSQGNRSFRSPSKPLAVSQQRPIVSAAPSSVLRRCQTARQRPCKDCGHRLSLIFPPCDMAGAAELSRFSNIERLP